jgi:hypothetical protein
MEFCKSLVRLEAGVDRSQKVNATPIERNYSSKDFVNLSSSTAVFRVKLEGLTINECTCNAIRQILSLKHRGTENTDKRKFALSVLCASVFLSF